jgi:hypothetical protein
MTANSSIFTTSLFGNSSGLTADEQAALDTATQEIFLKKTATSNMGTTIPAIPSNQRYMKD